jgi:hypothetical protein
MFSHRIRFAALLGLLLVTLACSLGGAAVTPTAEPASTEAAQLIPTREAPTVPPVAPTQVSTKAPPTAVPPTQTPTGTGPNGCILSAQFVADVTIPDGTVLAPGSAFVKTWRVKNTGTCEWVNYKLIFAAGEQMGGPASVGVNTTPAGGTVDVSVNLVAPTTPGEHKSGWRFQATNSSVFGNLYVIINVPAPATATPTTAPTAAPVAGPWNGQWVSNCGASSCGTVTLFQTGNVVTGTYADNGKVNGTVNGTRLSGTWTRSGTSGSFDWWLGGTGGKWRGNFNSVNGWCGYRVGETEPAPCGVGTFAGDWNAVCTSCDGPMQIYQDGRNFNGTYVNGTVQGTIDGVKATGAWSNKEGLTGPLTWYLLNAVQFNGNYNGANQWCGYRGGSSAPAECLKP